jgi:hypothetical protein
MTPPPPPERPSDDVEAGGDSACWAYLVCPGCGRIAEPDGPEPCMHCGSVDVEPTASTS